MARNGSLYCHVAIGFVNDIVTCRAMPHIHPTAHYDSRLGLHQTLLAKVSKNIHLLGRARLLAALTAVALAILAFNSGASWQWMVSGLGAALFLVLVRIHSRHEQQAMLLQLRIHLIKGEQEALAGNYAHFPKGEKYLNTNHPYSFDLDVFGAGSLYQLLCRSVTYNGADVLAASLMQPEINEERIYKRQAMIRALSENPVFLEDFQAEGAAVDEEPNDYKLVTGWLNAPEHFMNNGLAKVSMAILPVITIGLIFYTSFIGELQGAIGLAVIANWVVLGIFGKKIKSANTQVGRTARLVEKYQRLQSVTANAIFNQPELQSISQAAQESAAQIVRFRKLANMFDSRNNSMGGMILNSLFLFDIYCLLQLESWRRAHKALLLQTMESMIELDALVSCANYAFNHPDNHYPTFDTQGIQAKDLRHPLLAKSAVGNDCSLGEQEKIYLLTGANMTGKSTFIRTIGTATILSYMGVPVPAESLSLPLMNIFTAIRITDSVQNDVSYFRAELNRIKAIMDRVQSSGQRYLVLLDEPLRGTNSGDKQQGTRSIIEKLLKQNVMGIVATHDIGLCVLQEEHPGKISNYHFESTVTPAGLAFDFKLHSGGSTSNNATILMRQMGIIE